MLKVFTSAAASGDRPEFWDQNWDTQTLDDAEAVCERDPVWPLVMREVEGRRVFLEGGCGQGQWVRYLAARMPQAIGVDFAPRTIERLKAQHPTLDFRVGDVRSFQLPDRSVDTYYSAGVVEHFESGPELALAEAHRVVRPGGTFLCSVPDASPLRRALYRREESVHRAIGWTVARVTDTRSAEPPEGTKFFQYMFTEDEFRARLTSAGFTVSETVGLYVTWGLMEVPGFASVWASARRAVRAIRGLRQVRPPHGSVTAAAPATAKRVCSTPSLLERAVVREDTSTPVLGPVVGGASRLFPNMRMYVARRN
jgi:SAM-dependent methyltransferase